MQTWFAVQNFLFHESSLLDSHAYRTWLTLIAPDIHYSVTTPLFRDAGAAPVDVAVIDEDIVALRARIDQLSDPRLTRAENPASRTRRIIGNLQVVASDRQDTYIASCNLLVHRCRPNIPEGALYAGTRRDILRRNDTGFTIAARTVALDHTVLQGGAVSILF